MRRQRLIAIVVLGLSLAGAQSAAASLLLCQSSQQADCCCADTGMTPACGGMCSANGQPEAAEELAATTPSSKPAAISPILLAAMAPAGQTVRVTATLCRSRDVSRTFHAPPPKTYLLDCAFRL